MEATPEEAEQEKGQTDPAGTLYYPTVDEKGKPAWLRVGPESADARQTVMEPVTAAVDPVQQKIAENIRERRKYLRYTQQEAAQAMGIKRNTYAAYELGTSAAPAKELPKIAKVLNCSVAYLFGETEGMGKTAPTPENELPDYIIGMMVQRMLLALHPQARARAARMIIERFLSDLAAPGEYGRFPKDDLLRYAQRFTVADLIKQLEIEEEKN